MIVSLGLTIGSVMLDLEAARIFTLVVQNQSFSETARKLGVSAPVISKQVARLEKSLAARLLDRRRRQPAQRPAAAGRPGSLSRSERGTGVRRPRGGSGRWRLRPRPAPHRPARRTAGGAVLGCGAPGALRRTRLSPTPWHAAAAGRTRGPHLPALPAQRRYGCHPLGDRARGPCSQRAGERQLFH